MATPNPNFLLLLFLLTLTLTLINAQSPPFETLITNTNNNFTSRFSPSTIIIIVLLISSFLLLTFFSIYIRNCANTRNNTRINSSPPSSFPQFQLGLNPDLLQTFPTTIYSQVKPHKTKNCALECAICLTEFEDDDAIRLLPACDHVFHLDCVDSWLDTHVTCPVCRTDYSLYEIEIDPPREAEIRADDLERRILRCYSAGNLVGGGEGSLDRYRLRLPENLRREIFAGSSRRGRTIYLGRSDRWPSFFGRSLSARISSFRNWRKGEEDGGKVVDLGSNGC